ncbi:MAG: SIMPL domain-containing protein [Candidatus Symbiothrix sp.]|jgi:hypothetical protein|nr:SIMPL domain-containing protein [Candidatus Symbiothrix sp.]
MKNNFQSIVLGASIALGLLILGVCINKGLQSFSNKERVVTVKGLAEKNIKATSATISVRFDFSGDIPKDIVAKIDKKTVAIADYLKTQGYNDLKISELNLYDSKSYYVNDWVDGKRVQVKKDRYHASKAFEFQIADVEKAASIENAINIDLINKDLTSDISTAYRFPELNDIKPELIAESTKNARIAGEQFARDSKSRLGKIKTASQGQISIAGKYYSDSDDLSTTPEEPYMEKARVVSSIVFFLED